MSSQEDISDTPDCPPNGDIFKPKKKPKAIRVLTVMAYVLSVSMAAILLSIYYIFMWKGQPHIGAFASKQVGIENNSPIQRHVLNSNFSQEPLKGNEEMPNRPKLNVISNSADITSESVVNKSNIMTNATTNQTSGESAYSTHNTNYHNPTTDYNSSREHDLV